MNDLENLCAKLDETESKLFVMLAQGMNTSEISKRLSMSYQSVAEMSKSIKQKLKITTFQQIRDIAGQKISSAG